MTDPRRKLPWVRLVVGLVLVVGVMVLRAVIKDPSEAFWRLRGAEPRGP